MQSTQSTIIFDFDGTLADSVSVMIELYNTAAKESGKFDPVSIKELPTLRKLGYRKALKQKGIQFWEIPQLVHTLSHEMKAHMGDVKPYQGIVAMLKKLQEKNYRIGILTSNRIELVQDFLVQHDFPQFDFVVSEKTLFNKERALKKIMRRHTINPQNVIYVGDEPRDVTASKKAGVRVLAVTWGLGGKESFTPDKDQPTAIVDTPQQLLQKILEITDGDTDAQH